MHAPLLVADVAAEAVPTGHGRQLALPAGAYVPAWQAAQKVAAATPRP